MSPKYLKVLCVWEMSSPKKIIREWWEVNSCSIFLIVNSNRTLAFLVVQTDLFLYSCGLFFAHFVCVCLFVWVVLRWTLGFMMLSKCSTSEPHPALLILFFGEHCYQMADNIGFRENKSAFLHDLLGILGMQFSCFRNGQNET